MGRCWGWLWTVGHKTGTHNSPDGDPALELRSERLEAASQLRAVAAHGHSLVSPVWGAWVDGTGNTTYRSKRQAGPPNDL